GFWGGRQFQPAIERRWRRDADRSQLRPGARAIPRSDPDSEQAGSRLFISWRQKSPRADNQKSQNLLTGVQMLNPAS
ncbi:MAG: hypothetical protein ACE5GA_07540, partial [Candidatus Zixiibacteriota bacterium]